MLNQLASLARLDFSPRHRQPSALRVLLATIASIAGSLAADAILVVIGKAVFPSTKGFAHFQFPDYARLTVVGVIIACVAWPIVTRISSAPRWLFFRLAILVTLVLWLPDLYILYKGESAKAVAVLMVMHLAIAVVTYNLLVHIAPVRPASRASADGRPPVRGSADGRPPVRGSAARESAAGQRGTQLPAEQPPRGHHRHAR
ncbi:MAG: DUF6069 family protein [Streptosporangiaceae bacterium]